MRKTLLSLARDVLDVLRQAIRIGRGDFPAIPGDELLRAYLRVEGNYIRSRYFGGNPTSPMKVLGYRFDFTDYHNFRFLFREIFLEQDYHFLSESKSPHIIDCGSNIGSSILYFKKIYPRAVIIGFEPFEQAFRVLTRNIEDNRLHDVTVHNLALSDQRGSVPLFFNSSDPGSSIRSLSNRQPDRAESIPVETIPLSGFIDRPVDLLKVDIEGAELAVIRELRDANKLSLIRKAVIEYHHHIAQDGDCLSQLLELLEQNRFGYHLHGILNHSRWRDHVQGILIYAWRR